MGFTAETRRQSFEAIQPQLGKRQSMILDYLLDGREATAIEIARALGFTERNAVQPRLNELVRMGLVEAVGVKWDEQTQRSVAVYKAVYSDPKCGSCRSWRCFAADESKPLVMQEGGCLKGHGKRLREQKACEEMERR